MDVHLFSGTLPRLTGAALLLALAGCGNGVVTPGDGTIAQLEAVGGDGQRATIGEPAPEPLVVRALDRGGRPVTGAGIAFRFINTDGQVAPGTTTTDADGRATAQVTLGGSVGDQVVEARLVDASGVAVEFQLTGLQRQDPPGGDGGSGGSGPPGGGGGNGGGGSGGHGGDNGNGGNGDGHGGGSAGGGGSGGGGSAGGGGGGDQNGGSGHGHGKGKGQDQGGQGQDGGKGGHHHGD
jgi:hypothetical protein